MRPQNAHRFTLIEMLIVIAIIVILAALMAPTLQNALEKSRTITCINNEKQIGYACILYAEDNNDRLPNLGRWAPSLPGGDATYSQGWIFHLRQYVGRPKVVNLNKLVKKSVFECPNINKTGYYDNNQYVVKSGWIGCNYATNHRINNTSKPQRHAILSRIKSPSRVALVGDSGTKGFYEGDIANRWDRADYSYRHDRYQTICVLRVDGSAKPVFRFDYWFNNKSTLVFEAYSSKN